MSNDILKELSKPLTKDDIELRVGTVSEKGISLLIYKTARTDINRLNDVVGLNWKNQHFYDTNGLLCCKIAIYNEATKEWISREDVGVESNTEKEKGNYSDSFKRAGFRWGIGIELYNAPFIFISWNTQRDDRTNKYKAVKFYPSSLIITRYEVENKIPKIELSYNGEIVYSNFQKVQQKPKDNPPPKDDKSVKLISENQVLELEKLIKESKSDRERFLIAFKIQRLEDMPLSSYALALKGLSKKMEENKQKGENK